MGRLATKFARWAVGASNLPPDDELPQISFLDPLVPDCLYGRIEEDKKKAVGGVEVRIEKRRKERVKVEKPLDPNVRRRERVTYYDVKKKKNSGHVSGSNVLVARRGTQEAVEEKLNAGKKGKGKDGGNQQGEGKGKGKEGRDKKREKDEAKKEGSGGGEWKGADEAWTADEDQKLRDGKEANTSWKLLAQEIGRPQGQCKQRWKEIQQQPVSGAAASGGDDAQKPQEKKGKGKEGKKDGGKQHQQGEGKKGKKDKPAKTAAEEHTKHHHHSKSDRHAHNSRSYHRDCPASEARFTLAEWQTVQEDDLFSFGELQALSELISNDQSLSWECIASKFFDLTGRRVHWEDIRDKFVGLAAMGR